MPGPLRRFRLLAQLGWSRIVRPRSLHPVRLILVGYAGYVVAGWLLLASPWSRGGASASPLDHLFVATSAVSTTGLSPVDVAATYSRFGQLVLLLLIQLGGLGYMTVGSFLVLAGRGGLPRVRAEVGRTVMGLPASFDVGTFVRASIVFTVLLEAAGALALYPIFRRAGVPDPGWSAVFHSVSSFCTAGFGLYADSFEKFRGDVALNLVVSVLSLAGAVGFIVWVDLVNLLRGRVPRVTLTTRLILASTAVLVGGGAAFLYVAEPTLQGLPPGERLLAAGFQSMSASTTVGFNTVGIPGLSHASVLVLSLLMIVGASPAGTGGGLKVTTVSALLGVMRSTLRGESRVRFWGREVPLERVLVATAGLGFYLLTLAAGLGLLLLAEPAAFENLLFEAASALGTVGLSRGITSSLGDLGKLMIVALMFAGRVGPLTLGAALLPSPAPVPAAREDIAL